MSMRLSRRQLAFDVVMAAFFTVVGQLQLVVPNQDSEGAGPWPLNATLMALTTLPLAARRVAPGAVAGVVFGVHIVPSVITSHTATFWGTILPMAIVLYTAGRWGVRSRAPFVLSLPLLFMATFWIHVPSFRHWDDFVFSTMLYGFAWAAGHVIAAQVEQRRQLDDALGRLEAVHGERRRQVLLEERARIAREMHDVVAHGVSVMVVQAGAARMDLPADADNSRASLLAVERAGREVLDELRRTVSLLRAPEGGGPDGSPTPGFAEIPALVEAMRHAGLAIDLEMADLTHLEPGRGLAVYRLVQEALTNVLRHVGPSSVTVRVTAEPDIVVSVVDAGPRSGSVSGLATQRGGNGLVGLEERVGMYGGRLDAGPCDNGYSVRARIPAGGVG